MAKHAFGSILLTHPRCMPSAGIHLGLYYRHTHSVCSPQLYFLIYYHVLFLCMRTANADKYLIDKHLEHLILPLMALHVYIYL